MPFPVAKPQVAPCVRPLAAGVQLETVKKIAQAIFRLSTLHPWPPSPSLGVAPVANGKIPLSFTNLFKMSFSNFIRQSILHHNKLQIDIAIQSKTPKKVYKKK